MSLDTYIKSLTKYDGKKPFMLKYGSYILAPFIGTPFLLLMLLAVHLWADNGIGASGVILVLIGMSVAIYLSNTLGYRIINHWPSEAVKKYRSYQSVCEIITVIPQDDDFVNLDRILAGYMMENRPQPDDTKKYIKLRALCLPYTEEGNRYIDVNRLRYFIGEIDHLTKKQYHDEMMEVFEQICKNNQPAPKPKRKPKPKPDGSNTKAKKSSGKSRRGSAGFNDSAYRGGYSGRSSDFVGENDVDFFDLNNNGFDDVVDRFWSGDGDGGDW